VTGIPLEGARLTFSHNPSSTVGPNAPGIDCVGRPGSKHLHILPFGPQHHPLTHDYHKDNVYDERSITTPTHMKSILYSSRTCILPFARLFFSTVGSGESQLMGKASGRQCKETPPTAPGPLLIVASRRLLCLHLLGARFNTCLPSNWVQYQFALTAQFVDPLPPWHAFINYDASKVASLTTMQFS